MSNKDGVIRNPKILVVTYNWPPRNAIGTHRPYAWAKYWSDAGAHVTVLTAAKQPFDEPLDLDLPPIPGVNVREVEYGGVAGLVTKVFRSHRIRGWLKKARSWMVNRTGSNIDPREGWVDAAADEASMLAQSADIVVSTFGPPGAHLIAHRIKAENPRIIWVADYRDLWSIGHLAEISPLKRKELIAFERDEVCRNVDLVSAVSQDMVFQLTNLLGKRVVYAPNGFDIDEDAVAAQLAKPRQFCCGGEIRIVYTGMIYKGRRDPSPLLDALARLDQDGILGGRRVVVEFYGDRVDGIEFLKREPRYTQFVRFMGHVSRDKALAAQREADLLLLLESPEIDARGVLTGKLFEYMAAGRPILCVGSRPEFEIGRVLNETGTGVVFGPDQYPAIYSFLAEILRGGEEFPGYNPNFEAIMKYSRRRQAMQMLREIVALIGSDD